MLSIVTKEIAEDSSIHLLHKKTFYLLNETQHLTFIKLIRSLILRFFRISVMSRQLQIVISPCPALWIYGLKSLSQFFQTSRHFPFLSGFCPSGQTTGTSMMFF